MAQVKPLKTNHVQIVVDGLLTLGWMPNGATRSEVVRIPTARAPLSCRGRAGGELRTFGGRARFMLPATAWRVTVGPRVVCLYRQGADIRAGGNGENCDTKRVAEMGALTWLRCCRDFPLCAEMSPPIPDASPAKGREE